MPVLLRPALEQSLDLLRCPMCQARLHPDRGALRCPAGHTFDIARHGYVSLLTGSRATSGDDGPMARARARFLSTGGYEPVRRAVAQLASDDVPVPGTIVDAGCGTGYYLAGVLDQLPGARGLGLDTSARTLRFAARAHARAAAATWDVFRPFPLADGAADVVLDVFAPRNPSDFHRVLRPGGRLVVVRPTSRHLAELRGLPAMVTIDPAKEQRLHQALNPRFEAVVTERVEYTMPLTRQQALDLVGMTPSARHQAPADLADSAYLPDQVTVSVLATAFRAR
ncbi:putative RNA methyltransferase [Streptomyces sp. NPDC007983]|uniref:putative RNA methyltransferase n=1 Tax=Streptomyces sp. NPDC007983 TaxID=3364800 RepID=UPI0036E196DF